MKIACNWFHADAIQQAGDAIGELAEIHRDKNIVFEFDPPGPITLDTIHSILFLLQEGLDPQDE